MNFNARASMCFSRAQQLLLFLRSYFVSIYPLYLFLYDTVLDLVLGMGERVNYFVLFFHPHTNTHKHPTVHTYTFTTRAHPAHIYDSWAFATEIVLYFFHAFLFVYFCFNICIPCSAIAVVCRTKNQAYIEELFIAKILRRKLLDALEVCLKMWTHFEWKWKHETMHKNVADGNRCSGCCCSHSYRNDLSQMTKATIVHPNCCSHHFPTDYWSEFN